MVKALGCAAVALAVFALLAALTIVLDIPGGKRFRRYCFYSDMRTKPRQITERNRVKSPNRIMSNHRM